MNAQPASIARGVEDRDQNMSIGRITPTGYGAGLIARDIMRLLLDERVLLIAATHEGYVYALGPDSLRARAVESTHPDWMVGTYTRKCGKGRIDGDIREHAKGLQARASA